MDTTIDSKTRQRLKSKGPSRRLIGRLFMLAGVVAVAVIGGALWILVPRK